MIEEHEVVVIHEPTAVLKSALLSASHNLLAEAELASALGDRTLTLIGVVTEEHWELLREAAHNADSVVVALLDSYSPSALVRALKLGCDGVLDRNSPLDVVTSAVRAALREELLLPREYVRAALERENGRSALDAADKLRLSALMRGETVKAIAETEFVSERVMYRRLQGMYLRLGVRNRAEAIAAGGRVL